MSPGNAPTTRAPQPDKGGTANVIQIRSREVPAAPSVAVDLAKAEAVIGAGLRTFLDVGNALLTIRDRKLYREQHETFEAYCRDRWDLSRKQAYGQIAAAQVQGIVSPVGDIPNEAVARELAPLKDEPEILTATWRDVIEQHGERPTAKQTRVVVKARNPDSPSPADGVPATPAELLARQVIERKRRDGGRGIHDYTAKQIAEQEGVDIKEARAACRVLRRLSLISNFANRQMYLDDLADELLHEWDIPEALRVVPLEEIQSWIAANRTAASALRRIANEIEAALITNPAVADEIVT